MDPAHFGWIPEAGAEDAHDIDTPEDEFAERFSAALEKLVALARRGRAAFDVPAIVKLARAVASEVFAGTEARAGAHADETHDAVKQLLLLIIDAAMPAVSAHAAAVAFGLLGETQESLAAISKRHGITRQAFSKHVVGIRHAMGLPAIHGGRTMQERKKYQTAHVDRWQAIEQDAPAAD